jgi:hypothetical protein
MAALLFPTPTQLQNIATPASDTDGATKKYVDDSISSLIDGAPSVLDTLKEFSLALNGDASFASNITGLIGTKVNTSALANIAFSGNYTDLSNAPNLPTSLTDLGISDGTVGQVLTTDGSGNFIFANVSGGIGGATDRLSNNGFEVVLGNNGNLTLPQGSVIGETATTTVITPPGAAAGQSLVIRPTAGGSLTASGAIVPGENLTITLSNDYGSLDATDVTYTITGATAQQLGIGSLTGTFSAFFPIGSYPQTATVVLPIPVNTTATTFTLTLTSNSWNNISITVTGNGAVENSHVHLVAGNPATTDIYLGDDDQYVKIEKAGGNVVIGTNSNTNQWTFGTDGSLTLPQTNMNSSPAPVSLPGVTFTDGTYQTTAFNGVNLEFTYEGGGAASSGFTGGFDGNNDGPSVDGGESDSVYDKTMAKISLTNDYRDLDNLPTIVSMATLKQVVANSTDFGDFKSRIANM